MSKPSPLIPEAHEPTAVDAIELAENLRYAEPFDGSKLAYLALHKAYLAGVIVGSGMNVKAPDHEVIHSGTKRT